MVICLWSILVAVFEARFDSDLIVSGWRISHQASQKFSGKLPVCGPFHQRPWKWDSMFCGRRCQLPWNGRNCTASSQGWDAHAQESPPRTTILSLSEKTEDSACYTWSIERPSGPSVSTLPFPPPSSLGSPPLVVLLSAKADGCCSTGVCALAHQECATINSNGHLKVWDLREKQSQQPSKLFLPSVLPYLIPLTLPFESLNLILSFVDPVQVNDLHWTALTATLRSLMWWPPEGRTGLWSSGTWDRSVFQWPSLALMPVTVSLRPFSPDEVVPRSYVRFSSFSVGSSLSPKSSQ